MSIPENQEEIPEDPELTELRENVRATEARRMEMKALLNEAEDAYWVSRTSADIARRKLKDYHDRQFRQKRV